MPQGKLIQRKIGDKTISLLPPGYTDYDYMSVHKEGCVSSGEWKKLFFNPTLINKVFDKREKRINLVRDEYLKKTYMGLDYIRDGNTVLIPYFCSGQYDHLILKEVVTHGPIIESDYYVYYFYNDYYIQKKYRVKITATDAWYRIPYNMEYFYIVIPSKIVTPDAADRRDKISGVNPGEDFPTYSEPHRGSEYFGDLDFENFVKFMPRFAIMQGKR